MLVLTMRDLHSAALSVERMAFALLTFLALSFAFERIRSLVNLGGWVALTNVELVLWAAVSLWMLARLVAYRRPRVPQGLVIPLLLWVAILLLSAVAAPVHRADALKFVGRVLSGMFVGWAAYDLAYTPTRWRTLIRALAVSGLAVALLGLAEAANIGPVVAWLANFKHAPTRVGELIRISSTLVYATITAMVLELTFPLLLAWVLGTPRWWERVLLGVGAVAQLTALVLTLSRAGVLALLAALALMAGLAWRTRQRAVVIGTGMAGGMLLAVVVVLMLRNPVVVLRLTSETERLWYQAAYTAPDALTLRPGETITVPVTLINTGIRTWEADGSHPFALSYHVNRADGTPLLYDGLRTPLPTDVPRGGTIALQARLIAPLETGEYLVEWDMVQEGVTWFSWKGTQPARMRLAVVGESVAAVELPKSSPPSGLNVTAPSPGRLTLWRTAWKMFRARPLLGVGPDNFRLVYGHYAGVERWDRGVHANNLYIEWLADTGIVGTLAFLWFTWRLIQAVGRRLRVAAEHSVQDRWIWQLALTASLSAWFVHGLVDYFYEFTPTYVAFWLVAGLAVAEVERAE